MDDGKGYLTWLPKHENDKQVQIVTQLDQLYAYMPMITPSLPNRTKAVYIDKIRQRNIPAKRLLMLRIFPL